MLEDIRYWEASSWRDFVRNTLVPLRDLAGFLADRLASDPLGERARKIGELAGRAVKVAERVFGGSMGEEVPPEDLLEAFRRFLEKGANATAGCSKHTFFIWSTRKITKGYLEATYPELRSPERFRDVARILGWTVYWEPPPVNLRSLAELLEDYRVYAYPDYLALLDVSFEGGSYRLRLSSLPGAEETLGGLVCKLNEALWRLVRDKPGKAVIYEVSDVFGEYIRMSESMLERVAWKDKKYFITAISLEEVGVKSFSDYYSYDFEELAVKRIRRGVYSSSEISRISILEFWDTLMPPMFLGKYEFVLTPDKSRGVILARWY